MHENIAKFLENKITFEEFKALPLQGINEAADITIENITLQNITPLGIAAYSGKIALVLYLLGKNANPNIGRSPLLAALRNLSTIPDENDPYFLTAKVLITQCPGININISEGKDNRSALWIASVLGRHDVVIYLISKGADIYMPCGEGGLPAVFYAAEYGYSNVIEAFCQSDKSIINPFQTQKEYTYIFANTLFHKLSEDKLQKVMTVLLQYITADYPKFDLFRVVLVAHNRQFFKVETQMCDYLFTPENKEEIILQVLREKRVLFLDYLINSKKVSLDTSLLGNHPFDKSHEEKIDLTLIQIAVLTNSIDCLKKLLSRSFDPTFTQEKGLTAIYIAADVNNIEAATILLNSCKTPDINHQYERRFGECDLSLSAFQIAIIKKHKKMGKLLLSYGADPNLYVSGEYSLTVLMVLLKDMSGLKLLMNCNVDPNKGSPLLKAIEMGNLTAVKILAENPKTKIDPETFEAAAEKEFIPIIEALLERIDINKIDLYARSLFLALLFNKTKIVEVLVDFFISKNCTHNLKKHLGDYKKDFPAYFFDDEKEEMDDIEEQILAIEKKIEQYDEQHHTWSPHFNFSKGISTHQYLTQENFSKEEINCLKNEIKYKRKPRENNKSETINTTCSTSTSSQTLTWFNGKLNTQPLSVIENEENCFLWIPENEILEQKCNPDMLIQFKNKSRYKFGNTNIKKIDIDYTCTFEINEKLLYLEVSHELKIASSEARILLFPISSDNHSATLYLAGKFLPHGLHEKSDTQHLLSSLALNPLKIILPQCEPQNSPNNSTSTNASSCSL